MEYKSIASVLLYSITIYLITQYRILPIDGTPYWLFGVIIFLLTGNVALNIPGLMGEWASKFRKFQLLLSAILTVGVLSLVMTTAMIDRYRSAPSHGVHDIILQQEAAMRFILEGKNPYQEDYFGTPVESFYYAEFGEIAVNPALYHFVMPPWYLVFPFLFYFVTTPLIGFFDGRMVLLFLSVAASLIILRWFRDKGVALLTVVFLLLGPASVNYLIEGRSDMFALSWLIFSLFLLEKKKIFLSAVLFGLAIMSKQTIWFMVPFYFLYVFFKHKQFIHPLLGVALPCMILALPFFVWNPQAFIDSIFGYLSGNATHSYPISGYGIGMLLYTWGYITDIHAYYPFIIWQLIFGVPVLLFAGRMLIKKPTISRLVFSYALVLTIIWYMSRYFNNSHMAYIASILTFSTLKYLDEENT